MTAPITLGTKPGQHLVSTWPSGQNRSLDWQADNVVQGRPGAPVQLVLESEPGGRLSGGEFQSNSTFRTGTYEVTMQVADTQPGVVQGAFLFQGDYRAPRLEFDWEFVRGDPTRVFTVVHMDYGGKRHSVGHIVDLGFDASAAPHDYEIMLDGKSATYRVDGRVVGYFDATTMGGVWATGEVRSYSDIWFAPNNAWAGLSDGLKAPVTTTVHGSEMREGDLSGSRPILGGARADTLTGTGGDDYLSGRDGADVLHGGLGEDYLLGGDGAARDALYGGVGDDILVGEYGPDLIDGGPGQDRLYGGHVDYVDAQAPRKPESDVDTFSFRDGSHSAVGREDAVFGFTGHDILDVSRIDANDDRAGNQAFGWGAQRPYSAWLVESGGDQLLRADFTGDGRADFEVRVVEGGVGRDDISL
jgi:hypothetical protein